MAATRTWEIQNTARMAGMTHFVSLSILRQV